MCNAITIYNGKFNLGEKLATELATFVSLSDEELENKSIEEFFSEELLNTDFWTFWRTMFAFENWHSALEMKMYMNRFIHHVAGLPDLSALQFTRHDQFTSMVTPMINYSNYTIFDLKSQYRHKLSLEKELAMLVEIE